VIVDIVRLLNGCPLLPANAAVGVGPEHRLVCQCRRRTERGDWTGHEYNRLVV
jgi:hypothetical protein